MCKLVFSVYLFQNTFSGNCDLLKTSVPKGSPERPALKIQMRRAIMFRVVALRLLFKVVYLVSSYVVFGRGHI